MKVLHFGSSYLPGKGGNVVRMTNMLENYGVPDVELYVLTTTPAEDFDDEAYFGRTGIRVFRIAQLKEAETVLPKIVKDEGIDVVVTHIIPANIIACKCLPRSVKIATEIHSLIDSGSLKNFGKSLLHRFWLNRRTERYFVLSRGAAAYIRKAYHVPERKIVFLPNGCSRSEYGFRPGAAGWFTFGYAGTFYRFQGTEVLLQNAEEILKLGEDVRLYLIGGGEHEEDFRKLAERYPGRLILTGLIPKAEVSRHLDEIDVLMIPRPSMLETETAIPLKIFDSVESGKPVILSGVAGLTEVLGDGEAFVYDKNDPAGLLKACRAAYTERDRLPKVYEAAAAKLQTWPTWQEIHEKQAQALREVVDQ